MEILGVAASVLLKRDSMPLWTMLVTLVIYGTGLGFASAQLTSLVLSGVPVAQSGQASATQSTIRQWGTALGAAVSGSVLSAAVGMVMPAHLEAIPSLPTGVAQGLTQSVRSSAGNVISSMRMQDTKGQLGVLGPQVTEALTRGFTQGAQLSMAFAGVLLLVGLVASIKVRQAARKAGADRV